MEREDRLSCKWILLGVLIGVLAFLYLAKPETAEAAYTDEGVYYPNLWTEVDWGEYENQKETLKLQYSDMIVTGSGDFFTYHLSNEQKHLFEQKSNGVLYAWLKPNSHYIGVEYGVVKYCILRTSSASVYWEGCSMVGSTYDYRGSSSLCYTLPHSNLLYEPEPVNFTFVDINVNGTNYTVSELYPYYLGLKNPQGSIYLLFSDTPFTAKERDVYNWQFDVAPTSNVVCYSYFPGDTGNFLDSRSVSVGFDSFVTKSTTDYFCNYRIHDTDNPLYIFLPEKSTFDVEDYSVKDLYAALPDELSKYYYIIILLYSGRIL